MNNIFVKYILYLITKFIYLTCKIEQHGLSHLKKARQLGLTKSYVVATWHECLFAGIIGQTEMPLCPLISKSKDGDFAAYIVKKWGYTTIRGSSNRGGLKALKELQKLSKNHLAITLTIDGPRGPRRMCKKGVIELAKNVQIPIIPAFPTASKQWIFKKSWDQFKIPKPFSKIITYFGPPIMIPHDLPIEKYTSIQQNIEQLLKNLETSAFQELG